MKPPYYAVIFTSTRTIVEDDYQAMAQKMETLAAKQPGFLGIESVRGQDGVGITVSYWATLDSIAQWKANLAHLEAQRRGKVEWYSHYRVRVAKVEKDYEID